MSSVFEFESGVYGSGSWGFSTHGKSDRTEIVGSAGVITYSTFWDAPITLDRGDGVEKIVIENPQHVQQPLIQTVVDELTGVGKCPSAGVDVAATNWVIDQIMADTGYS